MKFRGKFTVAQLIELLKAMPQDATVLSVEGDLRRKTSRNLKIERDNAKGIVVIEGEKWA